MLHLKVVPVVVVKLLQGFDDQKIHRKPDWPSPIGVSSEQPRPRFRRFVIHAKRLACCRKPTTIWIFFVTARDGSDSKVGKNFRWLMHSLQEELHAMSAEQRRQPSLAAARNVPLRHQVRQVGAVF